MNRFSHVANKYLSVPSGTILTLYLQVNECFCLRDTNIYNMYIQCIYIKFYYYLHRVVFPGGSNGKESACSAGDGFYLWIGKNPWRMWW